MIKLKYQSVFNEKEDLVKFREIVLHSHNRLHNIPTKDKELSEWNGWVDTPANVEDNKKLVDRIVSTRRRLKRLGVDVLVVVGIGGSHLGTQAVYDFMKPQYTKVHEDQIELLFFGYTMNERHMKTMLNYIKDKNVALNIVSRSGSTLEVKVAYKILMKIMKERYITDRELNKRVLITSTKGSELHAKTKNGGVKNGPDFFEIPENIGGRYSTLTAVGLLPLGIADIKINKLLDGAHEAYEELLYPVPQNPAYLYACSRAALYAWASMDIELGVIFDPSMDYFMKWWRSIFAESEGKNNWGLFPAIALYTSELHSLGQWVQEGNSERTFETFHIVRQEGDIKIDGEYLSEEEKFLGERNVADMEYSVLRGVLDAHDNRVIGNGKKEELVPMPHIVFEWTDYSERTIGYALYYLQKAAAMYCLLCEVNPFDQPGVEAYKLAAMKYIKDGEIHEEKEDEILDYKPPVIDLEMPSDEEVKEKEMIEEARVELDLIDEEEEMEQPRYSKRQKRRMLAQQASEEDYVDEEMDFDNGEEMDVDNDDEMMDEYEDQEVKKVSRWKMRKQRNKRNKFDGERFEDDLDGEMIGSEEDHYSRESFSSETREDRFGDYSEELMEEEQSVMVANKSSRKHARKGTGVVETQDISRLKVGVEEIGEIRITIKPRRRKLLLRNLEDRNSQVKEEKKAEKKVEPKKEEAKPAVKKTVAKKATPKKTPAKKVEAKKETPKKAKPAAKKTVTKKATPKKTPAKKVEAKKETPKKAKPAAKKTVAKKATPKKAPAKKLAPAAKKTVAKKTPVKKAAPKKSAPARKNTSKKTTQVKMSSKVKDQKIFANQPIVKNANKPISEPKQKKVVTKSAQGKAYAKSKKAFPGIN